MTYRYLPFLLATFSAAAATYDSGSHTGIKPNTTRNDGIHLAVTAASNCAPHNVNFASVNVTSDVNAGGMDLRSYTSIVTFGDSYTTDGKNDGSTPDPPVVIPPNPKAGGRTTNGLTWIEDIALDTGAHLYDYAVGGAVVNKTLWPSKGNASDFVGQVQIFLSQNHTLDPEKTLYTVFFGINDWSASKTDGDNLPLAASDLIAQIQRLASPPTNARSFLVTDVYGRGKTDANGQAFKLQVFKALGSLYKSASGKFKSTIKGFKFSYVDLEPLWEAILGTTPGYAAFGYTSSGYCVANSSTTIGECSDPEHTFYVSFTCLYTVTQIACAFSRADAYTYNPRGVQWISGHPSLETHRIMADYIEEAVAFCRI